MERLDAEFLELCSDWAELKRVEVLCSRTTMGTWQAVVLIRDAQGLFFTNPILAADDRRKGEDPDARRGRIYSSLSRAIAEARSRRITQIAGASANGAKART